MSIYIITHKKFVQPDNPGYKSLLVGAYKGHVFGDLYDDMGDNISQKNPFFCELTGFYWLWKNSEDDYVGVVHYRRYFSKSISRKKILSEHDIKKKLAVYDIIVPNKVNIFKPVSKQLEESYKNDPTLLPLIREAVIKSHPEDILAYDKVMAGEEVYFCNMMICNKSLFDEYCEWLFSILSYVEKHINMSEYDDYQKRLYGFISERLLTVWIEKKQLRVCELGMINTEKSEGIIKEFLKGLRRVYSYNFTERGFINNIINSIRKNQLHDRRDDK